MQKLERRTAGSEIQLGTLFWTAVKMLMGEWGQGVLRGCIPSSLYDMSTPWSRNVVLNWLCFSSCYTDTLKMSGCIFITLKSCIKYLVSFFIYKETDTFFSHRRRNRYHGIFRTVVELGLGTIMQPSLSWLSLNSMWGRLMTNGVRLYHQEMHIMRFLFLFPPESQQSHLCMLESSSSIYNIEGAGKELGRVIFYLSFYRWFHDYIHTWDSNYQVSNSSFHWKKNRCHINLRHYHYFYYLD